MLFTQEQVYRCAQQAWHLSQQATLQHVQQQQLQPQQMALANEAAWENRFAAHAAAQQEQIATLQAQMSSSREKTQGTRSLVTGLVQEFQDKMAEDRKARAEEQQALLRSLQDALT